jgi:hypothetical protein
MVIAAVVAGVAVLEFAATTTWNDYLVRTARVPQYATYVLHSPPLNSNDMINRNVVGGVEIVRIGSTLLSPLTLGFWLLLPFALGLRALTRHVVRPAAVVIAAGTAVALIVTETRAALLGALAATALLLGAAGGSRRGRMRLAVLAGVGAFLLLPVVGATTLSQRASGTVDQTEPSASQHLSTTTSALWALIGSPVGRGLGTAPGVGDRFAVSAKLTSENSYLQVGNELGIWTMIVFIGLLVSVVRKARWIGAVEDSHHADRPPASRAPPEMAAAVAAGGVGLMVAGFFLHVWLDFPVSLTFWLFAGVALPARTAAAAAAPAAALPPAATTARRTAALAPA